MACSRAPRASAAGCARDPRLVAPALRLRPALRRRAAATVAAAAAASPALAAAQPGKTRLGFVGIGIMGLPMARPPPPPPPAAVARAALRRQ